MKRALILFSLSIILLSACTSNNTPKTQYYLLNSPTLNTSVGNTNSASIINNTNTPTITVNVLELPDYLKQPGLVLQLSDHQLHYSNFHMWAETLKTSVAHTLAQDLNTIDQYNHHVISAIASRPTDDTELVIEITAFHATHQSQVILAGSYWLQESKIPRLVKKHNFKLMVALTVDGYPHAVHKMRQAITLLSADISKNLNENKQADK